MMMSWFRSMFDPNAKKAAARARSFVRDRHPEFIVHEVFLRATETDRFVFAVFYSRPSVIVRPTSYCIVAVSRDSDEINELSVSTDSPYWMRGRK